MVTGNVRTLCHTLFEKEIFSLPEAMEVSNLSAVAVWFQH